MMDGCSQLSFTLLATQRDKLFPYKPRNWRASSHAFLPRGVQTRDLLMVCGPLLWAGTQPPWAWSGTSFTQKKGTSHTTVSGPSPMLAVIKLSEGPSPA